MFLVLAVLAVKSQASRLLPPWDDDAASSSSSPSLSMSNEKGSSAATGSCESPSADLDASSFAPPLPFPTSSDAPTTLLKRLAPAEVFPYRLRGILQQPEHSCAPMESPPASPKNLLSKPHPRARKGSPGASPVKFGGNYAPMSLVPLYDPAILALIASRTVCLCGRKAREGPLIED